jgi:hypothetical protein
MEACRVQSKSCPDLQTETNLDGESHTGECHDDEDRDEDRVGRNAVLEDVVAPSGANAAWGHAACAACEVLHDDDEARDGDDEGAAWRRRRVV